MPHRFLSYLSRFSFLLAGLALAALLINGLMWYGADQPANVPYVPAHHTTCGQPVEMRAEDYDLWGSTRPGHDLPLALVDFCDPIQLTRADGQTEIWFWLSVEVVGQVFPLTGWGYPWVDMETPAAADYREPRNPWWNERASIRAIPDEIGYLGGDGYACPFEEMTQRGLDLFFYRPEGFQLPVGTRREGWVCIYFDGGRTLPSTLIVSIQPDRARITQWVDKFMVTSGDPSAIPTLPEDQLCDFARRTHPATIQTSGVCSP
ncbi:MAG TPA: hypothetical protein VHP83_09115 [Aggregatilineaceae bacterium]|nr:hypothetical protein [Aggregatilineaceae bacterium]